ncbi:MAG: hypothetical protein ACOZQL_23090 [Myxococcota bacterium]
MILAADAVPFDAVTDNVGMIVMAIIVTVSWLLFRRMIELSNAKKKDGAPPKP